MDGELLCNDGTSEVVIADGPKSRPEQRKRDGDLGGRDDTGCGVSPNHAVTLLGNGAFAKVDGDGLLHNQTAGNAITCIAGWIRLHVVGFGVNHKGSSPIAVKRVGICAEIHALVDNRGLGIAFCVYRKIQHIAGVSTHGILQAMHFPIRIEVWTSGFEIRRFAFRVLMKVNGVLTGNQSPEVEFELDTGSNGLDLDGADVLARGVLDLNRDTTSLGHASR